MHKLVRDFQPSAVIIDPVSSLLSDDDAENAELMAVRLVDYLKTCGVTALMTSLTRNTVREETTEISISSIIDTWLLVKNIEVNGERNRLLYVLKSRGMAHSNQVREFLITSKGVNLVDVYTGPDGLLMGSARAQQEQLERRAHDLREQEVARKQRELARKRRSIEHNIAMLQEELEEQDQEMGVLASEGQATEDFYQQEHSAMSRRRGAD
jgi:circadian clock protein KaiC